MARDDLTRPAELPEAACRHFHYKEVHAQVVEGPTSGVAQFPYCTKRGGTYIEADVVEECMKGEQYCPMGQA